MHTPPDALGGYQITRRIATSDVVTTYLAFSAPQQASWGQGAPPGRKVALHVADAATSAEAAASADIFWQYGTAVADIDHPAIAPVVDVGHDGARSFVATGWIDAITLDQLLDRRRRLSVDDTVRLFSDVAAALDVVHARGIVHQALSPHTIWVERGGDGLGHAFLTGFGSAALLADRLRPGGDSGDTALLDAALYVAPEQLRGTAVDGRADQYALACAMYHCITGKPPFVRNTLPALFGAHLFARPAPPAGGLSPRRQEILLAGLAKQPGDRYPSCGHLLRAVRPPADPVPAVVHTAAADDTVELARPVVAAPGVAEAGAEPREPVVVSVDDAVRPSPRAGVSGWLASAPGPVWLLGVLVVLAGALGGLLVTRSASDGETPGAVLATRSGGSSDTVDLSAAEEVDASQPAVAPPDVTWRSGVQGGGVRAVTVVDGTAVAATTAGLWGFDAANGEPRWEHPAAARDVEGVTFVGDVVVFRSVGVLEGLDVGDGEVLWVRSDASTRDGRLRPGPDALYGIGSDGGASGIVAADPATGEELWHYHAPSADLPLDAGIAANGQLVVIAQDRRLTALDSGDEPTQSSGGRPELTQPLWTADVPDLWESSVLLTGRAVVFATTDGQVCSHATADGRRQWCTSVGDAASGDPVVIHGARTLVVVTPSGVAAVDPASGAERWFIDAAGRPTGAVVVSGEVVAVAEDRGTIRGLSLDDGAERWEVDLGRQVLSLAADDGGLLAGTRSGGVVRLGLTAGQR